VYQEEGMKNLLATALIVFALSQLALSHKPGSTGDKGEQASPPSARIDPNSIDFGDQVTKKPSKYQRITVTNTGGKKLYVNSVVVSGDDRQNFALVGDTCTGSAIDPSKSCVVDVCFTPSRTERHKAAIVFSDNATESPQNVPLTGRGINSADVPPGEDKQRR
jgi:centrosomal CEP192-like protein